MNKRVTIELIVSTVNGENVGKQIEEKLMNLVIRDIMEWKMIDVCICGIALPKSDGLLIYKCKCGQVWISRIRLIHKLVTEQLLTQEKNK